MENDYIIHSGIKGQKWGRRRWQNDDGSFNEAGKLRYGRIADNYKNKDGTFTEEGFKRYSLPTEYLDELNEEELQQLINRQKKQNELYDLTNRYHSSPETLSDAEKRAAEKDIAALRKANSEAREAMYRARNTKISGYEIQQRIKTDQSKEQLNTITAEKTNIENKNKTSWGATVLAVAGGITTIAAAATAIITLANKFKKSGP